MFSGILKALLCCLLTFVAVESNAISKSQSFVINPSPLLSTLWPLKLLESSYFWSYSLWCSLFCFVHVIGQCRALTGNLCSAACMCLALEYLFVGCGTLQPYPLIFLFSPSSVSPSLCLSIVPSGRFLALYFISFVGFSYLDAALVFNFLGFISSSFMAASILLFICV